MSVFLYPLKKNMKTIIEVIKGDITKINVDAIVNAANSSLLGGSGVDGAIHRAGGSEILQECQKIRNRQGKCNVGEAVITTAGKLPAKFVIHTVGPVWNNGNKNEVHLLSLAYENSLNLAVQNNIETIAFPNISTGIYKFPKILAADIAIRSIKSFNDNFNSLKKIIFVCFDDENYKIYNDILKK
jgi:O-acetyl-ADP-ribose deacetylase (regulator of RNase III)